MKIVIAGSSEPIARLLSKFLNKRGHEVHFVVKEPKVEGQISFDHVKQNGLMPCDAVINIPQKMILSHRLGTAQFEKEFFETRIEPTAFMKEAILKSQTPPKVWISFSSVGIYPKQDAKFHKESTEPGNDPTSELIKKWEESAALPEDFSTRLVIFRLGLVMSKNTGILSNLIPLFKIGLGSILGKGVEAFPWIYLKDLYWLLEYTFMTDSLVGTYNAVAPQLINSKDFSLALSRVMKKPIWFKFPRKFFIKRLGDTAEIVFSRSIVYPSRLLASGFEFRYPAIYPALVDCMSRGAHY